MITTRDIFNSAIKLRNFLNRISFFFINGALQKGLDTSIYIHSFHLTGEFSTQWFMVVFSKQVGLGPSIHRYIAVSARQQKNFK